MAQQAFRLPPVLRFSGKTAAFAALLVVAACATHRGPGDLGAPAPEPGTGGAEPGVLIGELLRPVDRGILGSTDYDLPIEANNWVQKELDFLVGQRKEMLDRWIDRGDFYRDFVHDVLREQGLPTDLFHLAMIESGFVPTAKSHAGAAGMWQFMPGTADDVGLRVDPSVDERLDPIRSTRAAARHLRDLYRIHGDWALATAAYNAGSGRIRRGLQAFGANDFWELAQIGDLAEETRQYVPRLYAVTIVARDRQRFGLQPAARVQGLAFDSVYIDNETSLEAIASLGGATAKQLEQLNPHLLRGSTPAGGYWIWVPEGVGMSLQRAYLASSLRSQGALARYAVRWGDTLSGLASASGVTSARIRELNPRVDFDRLITGTELRLPGPAAEALASRPIRDEPASQPSAPSEPSEGALLALATVASTTDESDQGPTSHRVESGETLSEIAVRYGVTVAAIQQANALEGTAIWSGQRLEIPSGARERRENETASIEHIVEAGDTLWGIARRYGTTIETIERSNELGQRPIRPGQVLTISR